ncbi:MAG: protein-glutamate O-methyltransferase CheR [Halioglobus sp.]
MRHAALNRHQSITGKQVVMLMEQLRAQAGIKIESPQPVIEGHIRNRMSALGIDDFSAYMSVFDDSISARAEWLALIDLLTVKETRFFRQAEALEGLAGYIESLMDQSTVAPDFSFWSAGCSGGQELYSIAMVVESIFGQQKPWSEWYGIGTDISFQAITEAQRGRYSESDIQTIPVKYRHPFVSKVSADEWEISENIRARANFFHSNLLQVNSTPFSDFDVIFCQNVLIYFEHETQIWIINQLVDRLKKGGLLVLGAGEDVRWTNSKMQRAGWSGVCAYKKLEV